MKKLLTFLLLGLFMISFATAAEWDNGISDYDSETEIITFKNGCIFEIGWTCMGDIIGQVQLKTPKDFEVARDYNYVWEMDAWVYEDYNNFLKQFEYQDLKNNKEKINRDLDIKIRSYENITVDDYDETTCTPQTIDNPGECTREVIGSHTEQREIWTRVTPADIKEADGIVTLRGYTNVQEGDKIDWSPVLFGVRVDHDIWAAWSESLEVDIVSWYNMDDASGAITDFYENNTGTNYGGSYEATGKIDFAMQGYNAEDEGIDLGSNFNYTDDISMSVWIKLDSNGDYKMVFTRTNEANWAAGYGLVITDSNKARFFIDDYATNFAETTTSLNTGTWYHIVGTYDKDLGSDQIRTYLNGVNEGNDTYTSSLSAGDDDALIAGRYDSGGSPSYGINASIDLVGFWNRAITQSEVTQLYNGGGGISPELGIAPSVVLTSPVDNANLTSTNIDFITAVTDQIQVANVSLYIDGVLNQTNISGFNGTYTFSKTIIEGIHNWSILAYNNISLSNQSATRTFNYTQPPINIQLIEPADAFVSSIPEVNISCNASDAIGVEQLNLTINGIVNETLTNSSIAENLTIFKELYFAEGIFTWGCQASNLVNTAASANRTLNVTYSSPVITLISPDDGSNTTNQNVTFNLSAIDINGISNVSLLLNGVINETNTSGINGTYSFNKILDEGFYNWSISTISILGKVTDSSNRSLIVHITSPNATILAPSGSIGYFLLGANETLSYNFSEPGQNLSEHLDECWYRYPSSNFSICYQESADEANQTGIDGSCGLNYDGNYNTVGNEIFINYTKPSGYSNATWKVFHGNRTGDTPYNVTILQSCLDYDNNFLMLKLVSLGDQFLGDLEYSYGQCYDGSWNNITDIRQKINDIGTGGGSTVLGTSSYAYDGVWIVNGNLEGATVFRGRSTNQWAVFAQSTRDSPAAWVEEAIYWDFRVGLNCTGTSQDFLYQAGQNGISIFATDNFGFTASDTSTWNYSVLELNQTFNNLTTEGATEEFTINFVKASSFQISTVNFIYNETAYSFPYSVSGDDVISQSSITVPKVGSDTNFTFYWNITLDDGSIITTDSNNQTALNINVDNCSTYTNLIYNFTQYDEENQSILTSNNTIELQINLYDTRKTSLLTNFSDQFININPVQFCTESSILLNANYSSYVIVKYYANSSTTNISHSIEYYNILNQTIGNTTIPINVKLYDLKTVDTTKFRLTFRDASYVFAPNIMVQVHRQYIQDNDFKIVEIPLTDSNGQTILNLVKDTIIYNLIMVNEAQEIVGTFNSITAFCQDFIIGDCTINLAPDSITSPAYDYDEEFDISISSPSYNNATQTISMSFVTGDLLPKTVRMEIVRNNDFGNRSVCSDSLLAASGLLSCDVSSITDTDQFLFISTYVDGELAKEDTTNLNSDILNFGTLNGAFYAFLLILALITLFMEDRKVLVISIGLGWVAVISLGLVNGKLIGFSSAGIWLLVSIAIVLWKLTKEESL